MPDSVIPLRYAAPLAASPGSRPVSSPGRVALGIAHADALLAGGLRGDALHEAYAGAREDAASGMALALLLAWRHCRDPVAQAGNGRSLIWAREISGPSLPYGPGLAELGIDPAVVTVLLLPDGRAVLRAALDSVRQGAAAAVLIELRGRQPLLDLTATRRLAMAAQDSRTMVWLVRGEAEPVPSAAHTRWRVAHAPADQSGRPAFDLTLLRQRGGPEGLHISMEWDRDTATFHSCAAPPLSDITLSDGALSGLMPAMAAG